MTKIEWDRHTASMREYRSKIRLEFWMILCDVWIPGTSKTQDDDMIVIICMCCVYCCVLRLGLYSNHTNYAVFKMRSIKAATFSDEGMVFK